MPSYHDNNFRPGTSSPSGKDQPVWKKLLKHPLAGLMVLFLFGGLIYMTKAAPWAVRLTMASLFCGLIYTRDASPAGRWITIGIIAVGTLLSILLPSVTNLVNSFLY
ncbi:MAG: hypothetical protein ONA90_00665 [candidate division KSB1 bacterium]|nr:hypothetical protein [candidate division KSB1 bacterium]